MIGRRHRLMGLLIAAALLTVSGCGSTTRPATARQPTSTPPVSTNDLLLTTSDLPTGFIPFTPTKAPRPFCGRQLDERPTSKAQATFAKPTGSAVVDIRDVISTYPSPTAARDAFEQARSLLETSCHLDVTPRGRDAITLDSSRPFGQDSMSVGQDLTDVPPVDGVDVAGIVAHAYYVLDGSSIITVGIATALIPRVGAEMLSGDSSLTLLKRLTSLQLKRFNSQTPAPGISA